MIRQLRSLCVVLLLALLAAGPAQAADGVEIEQASLETTDDGYRLSTSYAFELGRSLEEAINRGVPLYFTTDIEIKRPRWYWFDAKAIAESQTVRISYNVLTRQYHAGIVGRLQQTFPTLDDAVSLIRRPSRWIVAEKGALKGGSTYNVSIRMRLDVAQLPKPFQVHALNSNDWRLSSDWISFPFKAD